MDTDLSLERNQGELDIKMEKKCRIGMGGRKRERGNKRERDLGGEGGTERAILL